MKTKYISIWREKEKARRNRWKRELIEDILIIIIFLAIMAWAGFTFPY